MHKQLAPFPPVLLTLSLLTPPSFPSPLLFPPVPLFHCFFPSMSGQSFHGINKDAVSPTMGQVSTHQGLSPMQQPWLPKNMELLYPMLLWGVSEGGTATLEGGRQSSEPSEASS